MRELPQNWVKTQLAELLLDPKANIVDGPFGSNLKASEYEDSGTPILRIQNIKRFKFLSKNIKYIAQKKANDLHRHSYRPGDIIITKLGDPLGEACILPNNIETGIIVADLVRLRLDNNYIDNKWLCYAINSDGIANQLKNLTKGTTRPRVNLAHIRSLEINVPPLNEQKRIVTKIEELFSELDNGIVSLKSAHKQLKVYRQAVLKHAFEGKLTSEWRKDNRLPLRHGRMLREEILALRRSEWEKAEIQKSSARGSSLKGGDWKLRYPEPTKIDLEVLPEIPPEWCWVSLDELVSGKPRSMQSGPFGSNLRHNEFKPKGILVIGIDNVLDGKFSMGSQNRISEQKFSELRKYEARPGDLLVTVMASLGRTCVVPRSIETSIITKHVYRITMEPTFFLPEYYNLLLQTDGISRERMLKSAQGQTRPGLNSEILRGLPVPLCSLAEQQAIVDLLSERLSQIEVLDVVLDEQIKRLQPLRQTILKKAFTGQLVPQDPQDQPASVLLERIKADKAEQENGIKYNKRKKAA